MQRYAAVGTVTHLVGEEVSTSFAETTGKSLEANFDPHHAVTSSHSTFGRKGTQMVTPSDNIRINLAHPTGQPHPMAMLIKTRYQPI
jgi:hypothetical protein